MSTSGGVVLRVASYARFSSDGQREESIEAQERAISSYVSSKGWLLTSTYSDRAKTGTNTDRPEFQRMIRDAKSKMFDIVVAHKLDRMFRSVLDYEMTRTELMRYGIPIVFVSSPTSLEPTPSEEMLNGILAYTSQFYSRNLAGEVMKGQRENAMKAMHTGGRPPLGYDVLPDKTYAINEQEAEIVKKIFDLYDDGYSLSEVQTELRAMGYKTQTGNEFTPMTIRDVLRNPKYKGEYTFNKFAYNKIKKMGKKKNPKDEWIVVPNGMPAIVPPEQWDRVQAKMSDKYKGKGSTQRRYEAYALTGIMKCGLCGGRMVGKPSEKQGRVYQYYVCMNAKRGFCDAKAVRKDEAERVVAEAIKTHIGMDIELLVSEVEKAYLPEMEKRSRELSSLESSLEKKRKDGVKILEDGTANGFSEFHRTKLDSLAIEVKELEQRIADYPKEFTIPPRDVMIAAIKEIIESLDKPDLRLKAIKAATSQVVVDGDTLRIDFGLRGLVPEMVAEGGNNRRVRVPIAPSYTRRCDSEARKRLSLRRHALRSHLTGRFAVPE